MKLRPMTSLMIEKGLLTSGLMAGQLLLAPMVMSAPEGGVVEGIKIYRRDLTLRVALATHVGVDAVSATSHGDSGKERQQCDTPHEPDPTAFFFFAGSDAIFLAGRRAAMRSRLRLAASDPS